MTKRQLSKTCSPNSHALRDELVGAMELLEEEGVLKTVSALLDEGCGFRDIELLLNAGIKAVGDRYEQGEYFIADLIVSGIIYRGALALFQQNNKTPAGEPVGRVVIGVMKDDFHDIGKDIVSDMLRAEGFEVKDLGVNVGPERFVAEVEAYKPDVLLLCGLMKFVHEPMAETIKLIEKAGLRGSMAILAGGGCVDSGLYKRIGSDLSTAEPLDALEFCKKVAERKYDGNKSDD